MKNFSNSIKPSAEPAKIFGKRLKNFILPSKNFASLPKILGSKGKILGVEPNYLGSMSKFLGLRGKILGSMSKRLGIKINEKEARAWILRAKKQLISIKNKALSIGTKRLLVKICFYKSLTVSPSSGTKIRWKKPAWVALWRIISRVTL